MNTLEIFLTQLIMSFAVYTLLAKWVLSPWLREKAMSLALMILIAPHALRHVGLSFLVPSVTDPSLPASFAFTTAWGDFISALLAIVCLFALKHSWRLALPIVWVFNLIGTIDLVLALSQAEVVPLLAGTWYIPTFFVPLLLVTHGMIFVRLLKPQRSSVDALAV
ncbi:MAG: hypothetical protein V7746_24440 [Halioglobus sp.]